MFPSLASSLRSPLAAVPRALKQSALLVPVGRCQPKTLQLWNRAPRAAGYATSAAPNNAGGKLFKPLGGLVAAAVIGSGFYYWQKTDDHPPSISVAEKENEDEYTVIFVLGGPGAGKGTQCAKLVKNYGFVHLSAGDLLRAEKDRKGSEFGEMINNYIKEGKIVPMEVTIALLQKAMEASGGKRFLIDGFPRAMDQALQFEKTVCKPKAVLFFECPESEMLRRLLKRGESSGRTDDNIESIQKRFRTFLEVSLPVVNHYEERNKVITVSCMNTPEKVYEETTRKVEGIVGDMVKVTSTA